MHQNTAIRFDHGGLEASVLDPAVLNEDRDRTGIAGDVMRARENGFDMSVTESSLGRIEFRNAHDLRRTREK